MNKNIKNIIKEKLKRLRLSKNELFKNIKKSINQNNNISNNIKIYTNYNLEKNLNKYNTITKKKKICLYTGKRKTILKGFNFSRYIVKNLILKNQIINFKKKNW